MDDTGHQVADPAPGTSSGTPPGYVRFGSKPTQVIPIPWAEQILAALAEKYPAQFGNLLREAALQGTGQTGGRLRERKA